jgi:hypothetical protein
MNFEECKEIIKYECIAGNGFVVKLRGGEFTKSQFEKLYEALIFYKKFIEDKEMMEKEIVYCLYFLDVEITGVLKYFIKSDTYQELSLAQQKCSQLIVDIFTPKKFKGPLPENYA